AARTTSELGAKIRPDTNAPCRAIQTRSSGSFDSSAFTPRNVISAPPPIHTNEKKTWKTLKTRYQPADDARMTAATTNAMPTSAVERSTERREAGVGPAAVSTDGA